MTGPLDLDAVDLLAEHPPKFVLEFFLRPDWQSKLFRQNVSYQAQAVVETPVEAMTKGTGGLTAIVKLLFLSSTGG